MSALADNKALVLRYISFIEKGDVESALRLVADHATFWHPSSGDTDKEGLRASFKLIAPLMQSFRTHVRTLTAEEDRVSVELQAEIRFANGKDYSNRYHFMYVIADGKIVASREYVDTKPLDAVLAS